MAFSGELAKAGFDPQRIETTANVHLVKGEQGFKIETVDLQTKASVPDIEEDKFQELAENAKNNCPVSQLFKGAKINVNATLAG
jgi:osmotically inducible protein OsmC